MLNEKWKDALDKATSSRCADYMDLSPRIANAMIGADEFQKRVIEEVQKKIDFYPENAIYDFQTIPISCYKDILEIVKNLCPNIPPEYVLPCIKKNCCPVCGSDVFDGSGTGWEICTNTKCSWMG